MRELILTVGLPGSGKTTWAQSIQKAEPDTTVLSSRDDLRLKVFGRRGILPFKDEEILTEMQERMVNIALAHDKTVVVHDTNLRLAHRKRWAIQAALVGAHYMQIDFTHVNVDTCIKQDALRGMDSVGADVIRRMHRTVRSQTPPGGGPLPYPVLGKGEGLYEPYSHTPGLPPAILVDIDGTVAERSEGGRSPYDMTRVHEDLPRQQVINIVRNQAFGLRKPPRIIFLSGRDDSCFAQTELWLSKHVDVPIEGLFMRKEGDTRSDTIVKYELFNQHVRGKYNVQFVLDDRNKVVEMWRKVGLTCLQVQEGNF